MCRKILEYWIFKIFADVANFTSTVFAQLDSGFNFENFRDKFQNFFWKKRQVFEDLWIENRINVNCQLLQNWGFNFSPLINWKFSTFFLNFESQRDGHVLALFLSNKYFGIYCQIDSIRITWLTSSDVFPDQFIVLI